MNKRLSIFISILGLLIMASIPVKADSPNASIVHLYDTWLAEDVGCAISNGIVWQNVAIHRFEREFTHVDSGASFTQFTDTPQSVLRNYGEIRNIFQYRDFGAGWPFLPEYFEVGELWLLEVRAYRGDNNLVFESSKLVVSDCEGPQSL